METTGRLEKAFFCAADKADLPVCVCNPAQVRQFAGATGRLAKTDKQEAQDLARFGEAIKPAVSKLKPGKIRLIGDLLTVRSQCLEMSTMQKNRLRPMPTTAHSPIRKILETISGEIARIDRELDRLIAEVPEWQARVDQLTSAKDVDKALACTRLSELPVVGQWNRKQIAAPVGVAPMNRRSGRSAGKRFIRSGRRKLRTVLFASMMSAIQYHPKTKPMYERLAAAGKPRKVAMVACMRKQLTILDAMV